MTHWLRRNAGFLFTIYLTAGCAYWFVTNVTAIGMYTLAALAWLAFGRR